jgi:serine/threonine-protein kinase
MHRSVMQHDNLVERFLQEGRVANLIRHPAVVPVIDDGHLPDGSPYLVMEYLDGEAYDVFVAAEPGSKRRRRIEEAEAAFVFSQVAGVLVQAEELQLIHRDIKPANLFRVADGSVRLLDFGIARLQAEPIASGTATGMAVGTPAYMPPEQARGRSELVGAHSDQFSLAATILTLLAGRKLRRGETNAEEFAIAMMQPFPKVALSGIEVRPAFAEVLDRALSFEISERYPSAASLKAAIDRVFPDHAGARTISTGLRTVQSNTSALPSVTLQGFAPVDDVAPYEAALRVEARSAFPNIHASEASARLPELRRKRSSFRKSFGVFAILGVATFAVLVSARPSPQKRVTNALGNVFRVKCAEFRVEFDHFQASATGGPRVAPADVPGAESAAGSAPTNVTPSLMRTQLRVGPLPQAAGVAPNSFVGQVAPSSVAAKGVAHDPLDSYR